MIRESDHAKAQALVAQLLKEFEEVCRQSDSLAVIGQVLAEGAAGKPDSLDGQINEVWRQVTSLPSRIDCLHKLAMAMQALAAIEPADSSAARARRG